MCLGLWTRDLPASGSPYLLYDFGYKPGGERKRGLSTLGHIQKWTRGLIVTGMSAATIAIDLIGKQPRTYNTAHSITARVRNLIGLDYPPRSATSPEGTGGRPGDEKDPTGVKVLARNDIIFRGSTDHTRRANVWPSRPCNSSSQ